MKNKIMAYILAMSLFVAPVLISGCSGSGNDADTAPPEISSMIPGNTEEDVPLNTQITVVFSKSVINISTATFYLERVGSFGNVPATVLYNDSTRTAVLTPTENLEWDTIYAVTITNNVRSRSGVALEATSWVFTTGQQADSVPPSISDKSPAQSNYVPANGPVFVVFSERVNNVNGSTFHIKKNGTGAPLAATVSYNADTYKATLNAGTLEDWTSYTIYLSDTITDQAGNSLAVTQWTFVTDDTTQPSVESHSPLAGAMAVATNSSVSVSFSESLKSYTIHNNSANFQLLKDNGAGGFDTVDSSVIYNDATKTAILYPALPMANDTLYRVILSQDIRDLAHNQLDGTPGSDPLQWDFTTANVPDTDPPTVVLPTDPDDGETGVATNTSVTVQFNENVTGIGAGSYILEKVSDSSQVSGNVIYNPSTRVATFTPVAMLTEGIWYRAKLTSDIKDGASNALVPVSWTFKTLDSTLPSVVSKSPIDGAGGVGVNVNVTAVFTEEVTGVDTSSFTVKNETTGTMVAGDVAYSSATKTATFNPDVDLPFDSDYTVTLTNAVKDTSGNSLSTTSWTFQTGAQPDLDPPAVVSPTYPDHQSHQTNIPRSASISVRFSEPVTGVGPGTLLLKKGDKDGAAVNALISYDAVSNTATLVPNNNLDYSTVYSVVVEGGPTTDIMDTAGNKPASDTYWSFTTVADATAPVVVNKTPEQGTPDIPGNAVSITVIFSERVQNVTPATFKLLRDFGDFGEVAADVNYTYDPLTNTPSATLTPQANVENTGTYRVRLTGGITDISVAMNPLQTLEWTFSITALDETAPTIVNRVPASGEPNWTGKKVTVIFSEDVKWVSGSSFYVKDESDAVIPAVVTYSTGLLTAELEISQVLPYEKTFTAYLTDAIKDRASNQISPVSWTFSTPADKIAPTVTDVYPPNGTPAFPVNGQITATFSEGIQDYNGSTFYLSPAATANITYDAQTKTLTLVPQSNLQGSKEYTVYVATGIKDLATVPNSLASEYSWKFTTQNVPDTTPPVIVGGTRNPGPGATGVALTSNITLQFSENVVNSTSKITLLKGASAVGATVSYNPGNFTVTIDPQEDMDQSTVYTVRVLGGPTGVMDAAGNYLAATDQWTFTTEADVTNPTIIDRYPVSGATNTPLKPAVTVVFSEPVTGVSGSSFYVTGTGVPTCYVTYDEATRTATLTPGSNLSNGTVYTVNLTTAIQDRAGNSLATTWWTFTTNSLPVISDIAVSTDGSNFTTYADGAANVPFGTTHMRVTFNRAMNPAKNWLEIYEGATGINPAPASPGQWNWTGGNTVITYALTGRFKGGTAYQARLYGWGGSYEDTETNVVSRTAYVGDGIWNFTTAADGAAPAIASRIPASGATNVGRNIGVIIIRFNEMMNQTRDSRITLAPAVTATRSGWIDGGRTVVFTIPQLAASTAYTVTLNGGGNSFRDIAGTDASGSFNFTTGTSIGSTVEYLESFENNGVPNFSQFTNVSTDTGGDWTRYTSEKSGSGEALSPQDGSYLVKAAFWEWDFGLYADIENISSFSFSTSGTYIMTFQMFHERLYNMPDRVQVYASTDGSNYTPITAGALIDVLRYDWSLGSSAPVWQTHYVDLSQYSGSGTVYLRLRAISAGELGGNVIIDNLRITRY